MYICEQAAESNIHLGTSMYHLAPNAISSVVHQ